MPKSHFGNCLAAFSFIALLLLIPPLIWHAKSCNIPLTFLIVCLSIMNLENFINALIWSDTNAVWQGEVYCDIFARLEVITTIGKLCALIAINLNLVMIIRTNRRFLGRTKFKTYLNLAICTVLPVIVIAVHYIVEMQRYAIYRYRGCALSINTWVAILPYLMWPFVLSIIVIGFLAWTLFTYYQKYCDVADILKCTNSGYSHKRYIKLLVFQLLMILCIVPFLIYTFVRDTNFFKDVPFVWDWVHSYEWGYIMNFDAGKYITALEWINIGALYITFIVFGLGSEATKMYKGILYKVPYVKKMVEKHHQSSSDESEDETVDSKQYEYVRRTDPVPKNFLDHNVDMDKYVDLDNSGANFDYESQIDTPLSDKMNFEFNVSPIDEK